MPLYLVAIQPPDNYHPSLEGEAMIRDISALNEEMDAAGARFFAGGLESAAKAKSLRKQEPRSSHRYPPSRMTAIRAVWPKPASQVEERKESSAFRQGSVKQHERSPR